MPLMQLSTLVLPAPFGPIRANSCRPPRRRADSAVENRKAAEAQREPIDLELSHTTSAAAVLLDVAVAPAFAGGGLAEVEFLDVPGWPRSRSALPSSTMRPSPSRQP